VICKVSLLNRETQRLWLRRTLKVNLRNTSCSKSLTNQPNKINSLWSLSIQICRMSLKVRESRRTRKAKNRSKELSIWIKKSENLTNKSFKIKQNVKTRKSNSGAPSLKRTLTTSWSEIWKMRKKFLTTKSSSTLNRRKQNTRMIRFFFRVSRTVINTF